MASLSDFQLLSVACGVRYQPQYKVVDALGKVVDKVLRTEGTPFGPEFFPITASQVNQRTLLNEKTQDRLVISQTDTILAINEVPNGDHEYALRLLRAMEQHVLKHLDAIALAGVLRYGCVAVFQPCADLQLQSPSELLLGAEVARQAEMSVRFARRLPREEAVAKRSVNDYENVITNITCDLGRIQRVQFDVQDYFDPALTTKQRKERPLEPFIERAWRHLETIGVDFLNKRFAIQKAA